MEHPKRLLVGALLTEALDGAPDPVGSARALVDRIGMDPDDQLGVVQLVEDRHLLWAAARRSGAFTEDKVRQLAGHLETPDRARATYVLAALRSDDHEPWETRRLAQLHDLLQDALGRADLDAEQRNLVAVRRAEVIAQVGDDQRAVARAVAAPPAYLLAVDADDVARHLRSIDPLPPRKQFRIQITSLAQEGTWMLDVYGRDRAGLIAAVASTLASQGLDVVRATFVTWDDGAALETFVVIGATEPDASALQGLIEDAVASFTEAGPLPELSLEFDDKASPWHTVCEIDAPERPGLLGEVAAVFRAGGAAIRSATVTSHDGRAYDTFELTTLDGRKLDAAGQQRIRELAASGVVAQRRRFRPPVLAAARASG